ncbi:amidohydrolase family protein [Pseudocolwellia sp. HL-MZ7]|uniref:amidohydrolase family protein n=1 Tax=Pseudocolwellia sp. HL-MZ7 TaxID=3400627 RepID=UPI003CF7B316
MKIIDPHIHLFDLSLGEYQWLKPENPPFWSDKEVINNKFSETDINLSTQTKALELTGFVHIEAGFDNESPWREIQWLEASCKNDFRSVACIDLTAPANDFIKQINTLIDYKSVVGCRHILDDSACDILSHKNTFNNLKLLADNQLSFDLQMPLSDLKAIQILTDILKHLPELTIIINHAGSPPYFIKDHSNNIAVQSSELDHWLNGLKTLSQFEHCAIKCSGWEMEDRNYSSVWCDDIIAHCIQAFGINRVMLASNFPLCLFSKDYLKVWQYHSRLATYNQKQLTQLCLENTKHWYKF